MYLKSSFCLWMLKYLHLYITWHHFCFRASQSLFFMLRGKHFFKLYLRRLNNKLLSWTHHLVSLSRLKKSLFVVATEKPAERKQVKQLLTAGEKNGTSAAFSTYRSSILHWYFLCFHQFCLYCFLHSWLSAQRKCRFKSHNKLCHFTRLHIQDTQDCIKNRVAVPLYN